MSWVDTMRLRRRADQVRAAGWGVLAISLLACGVDFDDAPVLVAMAAGALALSYSLAHMFDRQADRVIAR